MIAAAALALLALAAALATARALLGPSVIDRAMAAAGLAALAAPIAVALSTQARGAALELALFVLPLGPLIALTVMKARRRRSLQPPLTPIETPQTRASGRSA